MEAHLRCPKRNSLEALQERGTLQAKRALNQEKRGEHCGPVSLLNGRGVGVEDSVLGMQGSPWVSVFSDGRSIAAGCEEAMFTRNHAHEQPWTHMTTSTQNFARND